MTELLTIFSSSGVTAIVLYVIQRWDKKRDEKKQSQSALSRMVLGLGHDKIVFLTDKYVERGGITLKEKRNLDSMYIPYRDMGGNGDGEIGYNACMGLPIISEEKAKECDQEILRKEFNFMKGNGNV